MPNIEIKAKCPNIENARQIADKIKTDYIGVLHQVDTYYQTKKGRLKLREINGKEAQLIPYYKEQIEGKHKSEYAVLTVSDAQSLKKILDKTLGEIFVVDKNREVFLVDNVRIHLDEVKKLGGFIEFEAVYTENSDADKERELFKVEDLKAQFGIRASDLLDKSYIDYLYELEKSDI